ncbi:hypothetical protein [Halococcus agarilyticus]|uniref:hypothetical protein n=1 Tax=Halococcus agarilyticus TaxID=1232219 RepID=UPI00067813C7|nr:hypothetical protein [Halococcus agarilyticus]
MRTRAVLAVVLCATVVLAGCAGLGGGGGNGTTASGADATETPAATADTTAAEDAATTTTGAADTTTAEDGETTADGGSPTASETMAAETTAAMTTTAGGDATATPSETAATTVSSAVGSGAFRFLAFEQPGTYTYEVTFAPTVSSQRGTAEPVTRQGENRSGQYVIDVVQASENQYEVQVSLSMDGMDNQQTFTGTRTEVQQQMLGSQVGVLLAPLTTMTGFYGGRPLQSGRSWSYSTEQGMASFEVTGTDSYAGVECSVTEASLNGTVVHEACVSPDRGLAPYAAYYDESGTLTFEMELTSYEAG